MMGFTSASNASSGSDKSLVEWAELERIGALSGLTSGEIVGLPGSLTSCSGRSSKLSAYGLLTAVVCIAASTLALPTCLYMRCSKILRIVN